MDKGKTKPIGKIKTGDKVEAANPKTGKHQGARTVQHVWINHDHDLLDLTVRTKDGHTATLHTTANHPFWDDTAHAWVAAGKLHHGDALNTATNGHAYVVNTQPTPGAANRWNLTVQQLHTYYVVAGGVPVLVHNTGCPTAAALRAAPHPANVSFATSVDLTRKTAAEAGDIQAVSGFATDIPDGYERAMPEQVYAAMSTERTPFFFDNSGGDGAYYLSHAEKQASTLRPGISISVSRDVCDNCIGWFQGRAAQLGVHLFVSDPTSIHVFAPDGSWTAYDYPPWEG
ncbi:hypothetical protein RKD27_000014 [Streptomyces sp. SAI-126]|jgi:hypothetical protein|uniref:polymorphic toxin-type HINT domain-containing protein n=1 Tax=unclassified Streptomyces TaxID=2593676 RepID=UPI0036EF4BFF